MQLDLFQQPQSNIDRQLTQQRVEQINGLRLLTDYIDVNYEKELIATIDRANWSNELKRRVQHYGYRYNYKARRITPESYLGPLPEWLNTLGHKLCDDRLINFVPDQVIINEYMPGQGIAPHVDCEPCFADTIASISLGSACSMIFERNEDKQRRELFVEPCSALIMSGEARYTWLHSIPARKVDQWSEPLFRSRRVSITFRKTVFG